MNLISKSLFTGYLLIKRLLYCVWPQSCTEIKPAVKYCN